jgi:O-antigen/teichoic acid export membrane protein
MVAAGDPRRAAAPDPAREHLRGSGLLLAGRLPSMGIHFAAQVLLVRQFSTAEYGALAYALTVVAFLGGFVALGLPGGLSRVVPTYHERGDYARMLGSLVLAAGAVSLLGAALVAAAWAWPGWLLRLAGGRDEPVQLLLILLVALPFEALERLLIALFASFTRAGAIFFRRHVLAPALRLGAVLLCAALDARVSFLAYSYVAATALGLAINGAVLLRVLRSEGVLPGFHLAAIRLPGRELARFALPLLASDLVALALPTLSTLLLGYHRDESQVASFRVILPAANLNTLVMGSFALLYTPALARLLARKDSAGINELYWRTSVWMAVLSFPVFCLTSSLAQPLTLLLYGER